jgi:hypothetical protein
LTKFSVAFWLYKSNKWGVLIHLFFACHFKILASNGCSINVIKGFFTFFLSFEFVRSNVSFFFLLNKIIFSFFFIDFGKNNLSHFFAKNQTDFETAIHEVAKWLTPRGQNKPSFSQEQLFATVVQNFNVFIKVKIKCFTWLLRKQLVYPAKKQNNCLCEKKMKKKTLVFTRGGDNY